MKLGKKDPKYDPRTLTFAAYRTANPLPIAPQSLPRRPRHFGHFDLIAPDAWGSLGNDKYGDCVLAAGGHETMMWAAETGRTVTFREEDSLSDYSAITGFDPNNASATDNGTVMLDALNYRRNTGLRDSAGDRHLLPAYVQLEPGNYEQILEACYLFGAVEIGFQFPSSAWDQFSQNRPWQFLSASIPIEGGHDVPIVGYHSRYLEVITWGRVQRMTKRFFQKYCDEAYALLDDEMLSAAGKSPEGFDFAALQADLAALA